MIKSYLGEIYIKYEMGNNRFERIYKLAQVDFRKRYYNDKLGLLWALINPLTQIAIYYFVFTKIMGRGKAIPNFSLYLFCGLLIWIPFSQATLTAMRIFHSKKYLLENIQFNWLDLFYTHMISTTIGLGFNLGAYFIGLLLIGVQLGDFWYFFPIVLVSWFLVSFSASIFLSIFRLYFDDTAHIWGLALMIGFWTSGIFFPGEFFLENYPSLAYINPFVGIILNSRACLLEGNDLYPNLLIINLLYSIIFTFIAVIYFKYNSQKVVEFL